MKAGVRTPQPRPSSSIGPNNASRFRIWTAELVQLAERVGHEWRFERDAVHQAIRDAIEDKRGAPFLQASKLRPPFDMTPAEIDNAIERAIDSASKPRHGKYANEIEPQPISWLWPERFARGKISIIDGDPGTGKSTLTTDIAARVSKGLSFPDGAPPFRGKVVMLSAEDGPADTIRPRLESAGADLERVVVMHPSLGAADEELLAFPKDLPKLEETVMRVHACLVIVDPMSAFLSGDLDGYKDQDIRRFTTALSAIAERTGSAVVLVRHLSKGEKSNALYRGLGSIGTIAAARSGFLVAKHPRDHGQNPQRVFVATKSNLAPLPPTLAFSLIADPQTRMARIEWSPESVSVTAEDVFVNRAGNDANGLGAAVAFLTKALKEGPRRTAEIEARAAEEGITKRTLERAREAMGILSSKVKAELNGSWWLCLPGSRSCSRCGNERGAEEVHGLL